MVTKKKRALVFAVLFLVFMSAGIASAQESGFNNFIKEFLQRLDIIQEPGFSPGENFGIKADTFEGGVQFLVMGGTQCTVTQTGNIRGSSGSATDKTGSSVSIDGNVAVMGSHQEDSNGVANAGAAYVLRYNGNSWVEEKKLIASDFSSEDQFGKAVAILGNVIVVGAYKDDISGFSDSGAAYVFRYNGTDWKQEKKLTPFDPAAGDNYGYSVSISGDKIAVGSYMDDDLGSSTGSIYVYKYTGSDWVLEKKIVPPRPTEFFGVSVGIEGNLIIGGAYWANLNNTGAGTGAAYIYRYNGNDWILDGTLSAYDGLANDYFGRAVAISGNRAVVGAEGDEWVAENLFERGSAYVFKYQNGNWVFERKLTSEDASAYDRYGTSVDIQGEIILIGSPYAEDHNLAWPRTDQGLAYLYKYDSSTSNWVESRVVASDGYYYDMFGTSVSISGNNFVVGAPGDAALGTDSGSAYLFRADCATGGCTSNAECNDNNACTDDICNTGTGVCSNANDNTNTCSDNLFCTINDRCNAGTCVADTRSCSNGLFCDGAETCNENTDACQAGTPVNCPAGQACNEASDQCIATQVCNNGIKEGTEQCDISDFGLAGESNLCSAYSGIYVSGTLTCSSTCTVITTQCFEKGQCTSNEYCNDGAFCNGVETCNLQTRECVSGSVPCSGGQSCNEVSDQCVQDPVCGNNQVEGTEQCDDGNTINGDGCENDCRLTPLAECGNNQVEGTEQCDDGNTINGDGCSSTCQTEVLPCDLITSTWNNLTNQPITQAFEGQDVKLKAVGNNCNGKTIVLSIYEDDDGIFSDDDFVVNFTDVFPPVGNVNRYDWKTVWEYDGPFGDPEYYFITTLPENPNELSTSANLNVIRSNAVCGDGAIQDGESCEGSNFAGSGLCIDFDSELYSGGNLQCDSTCGVDVSQCELIQEVPVCGDGIVNNESEECDDGDGINTNLCSNSCMLTKYYRTFLSSGRLNGNMIYSGSTGKAAADKMCYTEAKNAGMNSKSKWKAFLSDGTGNVNSFSNPKLIAYRTTSNKLVARNFSDLVDGSLISPIYPFGGSPSGNVWTGTGIGGVSTGMNCNNWKSNSASYQGSYGLAGRMNEIWMNAGNLDCSQQLKVYCVEQPWCGNGIRDGVEDCDDGNSNNSDGCPTTCRYGRGQDSGPKSISPSDFPNVLRTA